LPHTIISVASGCNELAEILNILILRRFEELPAVNIWMIITVYIIVVRLQESWEIVLPMLLTTPFHSTIETAAMLAMIAHKPSDVHHTWSVSSNHS
jgi:hypothetical protein